MPVKELKIGCGKPTGAKVGEKSETNKQKFLASIMTYQNLLKTSTCETTSRQIQENALHVYREAFNTYVTTSKELPYRQTPYYEQMRAAAQ